MTTVTDDREVIPWELDQVGLYKRLQNVGSGIYDHIMEVMQNSFDSTANPLTDPNRIEINVPDNGDLVLSVCDHGLSLGKDYGGKVGNFLRAKKASSEKPSSNIGRWGLGMIQYQNIAKMPVLITQTEELIYRIAIEKRNGLPCYVSDDPCAITKSNQQKLGIFHRGTVAEFRGHLEGIPKIDAKKLDSKIAETFTVRMMQNPNIIIEINLKKVELPSFAKGHKLEHICNLKQFKNEKNETIKPEVIGFIHGDRNGIGELRIYIRGMFVQKMNFGLRRCSGIINCDELQIDSARGRVVENDLFEDLHKRVSAEVEKFPEVESKDDKTDEKQYKKIESMFNDALAKLARLAPTGFGGNKDKTKIESTGDKGNEIFGYTVSEEPKEGRIIIEKEPHTRDPKHQGTVSKTGTNKTKRLNDKEDERDQQPTIKMNPRPIGDNMGLMRFDSANNILMIDQLDRCYDFVFKPKNKSINLIYQRATPYLANIWMKEKEDITDMTLEEILRIQERYVTAMLEDYL